jgi:hypothetical protein
MERDGGSPRTLHDLYARLRPVVSALFACPSHLREIEDDAELEPYIPAEFLMPEGLLRIRPAVRRRLLRLTEGAPVTTPRLRQLIVTDLLTLLHECLHSLGPAGLRRKQAAHAPNDHDGSHAFNEGFIEWAAQRSLASFIRALGLDRTHPWLLTTPPEQAYAPLAGAAGAIVIHVAALQGRTPHEQTARMLRVGTPMFALDLLAREWLAASGRPPTPAARARVVGDINATMRAITATGGGPVAGVRAASELIARVDALLGSATPEAASRSVA